jgi:hypothetical protein
MVNSRMKGWLIWLVMWQGFQNGVKQGWRHHRIQYEPSDRYANLISDVKEGPERWPFSCSRVWDCAELTMEPQYTFMARWLDMGINIYY